MLGDKKTCLEVGDSVIFREEDLSMQIVTQRGERKLPLNILFSRNDDDRIFGNFPPGMSPMSFSIFVEVMKGAFAIAGAEIRFMRKSPHQHYYLVVSAHGSTMEPKLLSQLMKRIQVVSPLFPPK